MRLAAVLALLLLAAPVAQARRPHHRLIAHVHRGYGQAPASWTSLPPALTPTPVPTVVATPDATATPTATPGSTLPPVNPHSVSVQSTEYTFTLTQKTVAAGDVRVQFDNGRAQDPHSLSIDGPDPEYWSFDELAPGTVTSRTITLKPGTYVLFCPIGDHEARGMHATLTVR